jgi:hypothetical protein
MYDHISNPEWLMKAAQNPEMVDLLRQRIEITLQRADLAIPKAPEAPAAPDYSSPQYEQAATAITTEEIENALDLIGRDLSEAERKDISAAVLEVTPAFWVMRDGEPALSLDALQRRVEREVNAVKRVREAALKADVDKKAREAAAFNAAMKTPTPPVATRPKPKPATVGASDNKVTFDQAWNNDDD